MELFFIIVYLFPIVIALLSGAFGTVEIQIDRFKFKKKINYKWLLFIPGINLIVLFELLGAISKHED